MDLNNLSFFKLANQEMQYLTERQKVLASNVANANTPGYIAKDLEKPSFSETLNSTVTMRVTNEKHMTSSSSKSGGKIYTPRVKNALTIDGNGVVLEDQLNEVSKVKSDYNKIITVYGKYKSMLSTANTRISG